MNMEWIQILVSVFAGLATAIPLVIKLVEYVQKAVKERNWNRMLDLLMDLMEAAENKFETGAEKKEWVLAMIQTSADNINYDIDMAAISQLIDNLCDMSKIVNAPNKTQEVEEK